MKYAILCLLLTSCITGLFAGIPEETGSIEVFFCDKVDCAAIFAEKASNAQSIDCAMYHADKGFFDSAKNARFVVDEEHSLPGAVKEHGGGLMHNKFCIIDNFVWTGSWNPSQAMTIPNNVVFIQSSTLANAYKSEFDELFKGKFHGGNSEPGLVRFNGNITEAYFCPEDDCQKRVLEVLKTAEKSIHFMTYSFTDDSIGDLLLEKSRNLEVKGVFDPRKDKYSEYDKLKDLSKIKKVHHKVFIVDSDTVVTGSYNPTKNADENNDENIIIIRDSNVAMLFEKEFEELFD